MHGRAPHFPSGAQDPVGGGRACHLVNRVVHSSVGVEQNRGACGGIRACNVGGGGQEGSRGMMAAVRSAVGGEQGATHWYMHRA